MKAHFEMMAAYNAWANARAYAAAAELSDRDLRADHGAAFRSVLGTLNHAMVADLIWLARFRDVAPPAFALDHVLHDDMAELTAARRVLDDDIRRFAADLREDCATQAITYRTATDRREVTETLGPALAHFFNHQTHHRGQVHALLTRVAGRAPSLDLIQFVRGAA